MNKENLDWVERETKVRNFSYRKTLDLTKEQKREIVLRIARFVRKGLTTYSNLNIRQDGSRYKKYYFKCPCGSCIEGYSFINEKDLEKEDELLRTSYNMWYAVFNHFRYHIRMNGDDFHIGLLVQIYGLKSTLTLLEYWAKKNMIVAIKLKTIVEELERDVLEQKKVTGEKT